MVARCIAGVGLGVLAGLAWAAAFPPLEVAPLAFAALAPLWLAVRNLRPLPAAGVGLVAGWVGQLGHTWWLLEDMPPLGYALATLVCATWVAAFGAFASLAQRRRPAVAPFLAAAAWVLLEWGRTHAGFLSAPLGLLGYAAWQTPVVARVAALAGVHGISFVAATTGVTLAATPELLAGRRPAGGPGLALALALSAALLAGATALPEPDPEGPGLEVVVVQAGIATPPSDARARLTTFAHYAALTRDAAHEHPALVVWPESAMPAALPTDGAASSLLARLSTEVGADLLVGGSPRGKDDPVGPGVPWANSAFLFAPGRQLVGRYDKVRLLPFNEYLPLRDTIAWPRALAPPVRDAAPGRKRGLLEVDGRHFGVLICWENLFASAFRETLAGGADFVVSLTNESFTRHPSARRQLFAINALRAIESGVWVVRAATTGISAVVDPLGRVVAELPLDRVEGSLSVRIGTRRIPTPYARFGDVFVAGLAVAIVACGTAGRRLGRTA